MNIRSCISPQILLSTGLFGEHGSVEKVQYFLLKVAGGGLFHEHRVTSERVNSVAAIYKQIK